MKITSSFLKKLVKEELIKERLAVDEKNLKDAIVQSLVSLYFRHEIQPEEAAKELAAAAQSEIDQINSRSITRRR